MLCPAYPYQQPCEPMGVVEPDLGIEDPFCLEAVSDFVQVVGWMGNPPVFNGVRWKNYAAIFSFIAGVTPPMAKLGQSLL